MEAFGRIHSMETFSTVDGPGIRLVVFLQGCLLHCIYCHNPDTWNIKAGEKICVSELIERIKDYFCYIKNGGITVSGGEPLLQSEFVCCLFKSCKDLNIHTAIETAASVPLKSCVAALEQTDLLIVDVKGVETTNVEKICRLDVKNLVEIFNYCEKEKKRVWVRYVLLPGFTMGYEKVFELAEFLKKFSVVERVELLPFHKMGEYKWEELNYEYILGEVLPPTQEEVLKVVEIFRDIGIEVVV